MNHVNTDAAVKALKQLADKESIEKLKRTPGLAFRKLTEDKRVGAYTARLIYLAMLAGLIDHVEKDDSDDTGLVKFVSDECGLRKSVAVEITGIFKAAFSREHVDELERRVDEGFRELSTGTFDIYVENENSEWRHGGVHVDCSYKASVTVRVIDRKTARKKLSSILDEEPYTSSETLKNFLESQLQKDLDYDFVQYCIEDDYYPPVPEDYDDNFREDVLKPFCEKFGLECVSFSGQGEGADSYIRN